MRKFLSKCQINRIKTVETVDYYLEALGDYIATSAARAAIEQCVVNVTFSYFLFVIYFDDSVILVI